jgi:hypothetical protein
LKRGFFRGLLNQSTYTNSVKKWHVELQQINMFWYELIVNGHDEIDTKKEIFSIMKQFKEAIESHIEKRFIYFICSRKKVRFSITNPPIMVDGDSKVKLCIEVGKEKEIKEISIDVPVDQSGKSLKVEIDIAFLMPVRYDFRIKFSI